MSFSYVLSREADNDLQDIYDYTSDQFGTTQALAYLSGIDDVLENLCRHPHSGRVRNEVKDGLRSISYVSHVVFYRVIKRQIWIVRILHTSRDLPRFL